MSRSPSSSDPVLDSGPASINEDRFAANREARRKEVSAHGWKAYKKGGKPIWCPGCGDYGVLNALYRALAELKAAPEQVAVISGIGCSSRLPHFVNTYGFNSIHGRALPLATGVKVANHAITVIAVGGDGDGLSIGMGHFAHAARRNIDILYLMMDNGIYAMTKGQASPTTPTGAVTAWTAFGASDPSLNPVGLALSFGAAFVARGYSGEPRQLTSMIVEGVRHPGFAFVHVLSPCVTYGSKHQYDEIRERAYPIDLPHDPSSKTMAVTLAGETDRIPLGVFYRELRPTLQEKLGEIKKEITSEPGAESVEDVIRSFLP